MDFELDIEFSSSDFEGSSQGSSLPSLESEDDEDVNVAADANRNDPNWNQITDFDDYGADARAFLHESGPTHNLDEDATPLDYFSLFWDDGLFSLLVAETNR